MNNKFTFLMAMILAGPAAADVTVTRSVQSDGFSGFGGSVKQTTTWIAKDKQRLDTQSEGKPTMMEKLAGLNRPEITRLDKRLIWRLNVPKKSYDERPLVTPSAAKESGSDTGGESSEGSGEPEKPTTRISKAEFKVTPLGQHKKIASFDCEGYQLRALLETEDLETGKKSEMRMLNTIWTTPEQGAVAQLKKEESEYAQAYAKAIGMTEAAKEGFQMLGTAMVASLAGSGEKELSRALAGMPAELKKLKGYPISVRVEWYGTPDEAPAAEGENTEMPENVSDALGGLASGLMKKKMDSKKPKPTAEGQLVFAMTTEVKSIATGAVAGETFEVPAGFKKTR